MSGPRHADRPSHTEGSRLDADRLEVAPGTLHEAVEGWVPQLTSEEELRIALETAFDYRGDVTLTLKDNSKIEGYVFDRVVGNSLSNSFVRDRKSTRLNSSHVAISYAVFCLKKKKKKKVDMNNENKLKSIEIEIRHS